MVAERTGERTWTVDEVARMGRAGIIEDPDRYEVFDGRVWEKVSQNAPHMWGVSLGLRALIGVFGIERIVVQGTLRLSPRDAPEPDLLLVKTFAPRRGMENVDLIVEVSDETLARDLGPKAAVYARYGAPEYWVLDIPNRQIHVHRGAEGEGWTDVRILGEGESVSPLAAPDQTLSVAALMPPPDA